MKLMKKTIQIQDSNNFQIWKYSKYSIRNQIWNHIRLRIQIHMHDQYQILRQIRNKINEISERTDQ